MSDAARGVVRRIHGTAEGLDPVTLMEVCGTHTVAIHRAGIRGLLPENVRLISGPGCPVCVTPVLDIDTACALATEIESVVTTFGDLMRVPGSRSSLDTVRAEGADVRVVLSPLDALRIARDEPDRIVVFLAVGFETTAPTTAATVLRARRDRVDNFYVASFHKVMPPPMRALADDPDMRIDGFLCPGHVSMVAGAEPFEFLARDHGKACVVSGFEPEDVLLSVLMLLEQIREERPTVEIQYGRAVRPHGNPHARAVVESVFEPFDSDWRGLGRLPDSGLALRPEFEDHDAFEPWHLDIGFPIEHDGCRCGEVLQGKVEPEECPLFGDPCTPESPVGACMVSAEGACAASFRFGGRP